MASKILFLALLASGLRGGAGCMPDGYKRAASGARKAYKKLSSPMSHVKAREACMADGAHLMMPKSKEDFDDIRRHFGNAGKYRMVNLNIMKSSTICLCSE